MNKKVMSILVLLIAVVLLAGCDFSNFGFGSDSKVLRDEYDTFEITVPSSVKFENNDYASENDYYLAVYSAKEEYYIYVSAYEQLEDQELSDFVLEDRDSFAENVDGREISDVTTLTVNDYTVYTYNFVYTDVEYDDKDFFIQVAWIQTADYLYCMDIEIMNSNYEKHKDTVVPVIESFKEL